MAEEFGIEEMKVENWFKYERRKMLSSGKSKLLEVFLLENIKKIFNIFSEKKEIY